MKPPCIPLNVRSCYSFLDSTLSPEAIVRLAVRYELPAIAVTDTGSLHGAPELARLAQEAGIRPVFGAEVFIGAQPLLLYVENARGWENLCRLLSRKAVVLEDEGTVAALHRRPLRREALQGLTDGLIAVSTDVSLAPLFPGRFYCAVTSARDDTRGLPGVVCPRVHYAVPEDRLKWDILQSIRTGTLLRQTHPEKKTGGSYHFRSPAELARRFQENPRLLAHTREIADRCTFAFPFGPPQFPEWQPPDGSTPHEFLRGLVMEGLQ